MQTYFYSLTLEGLDVKRIVTLLLDSLHNGLQTDCLTIPCESNQRRVLNKKVVDYLEDRT